MMQLLIADVSNNQQTFWNPSSDKLELGSMVAPALNGNIYSSHEKIMGYLPRCHQRKAYLLQHAGIFYLHYCYPDGKILFECHGILLAL
jgi:hypothetical protein